MATPQSASASAVHLVTTSAETRQILRQKFWGVISRIVYYPTALVGMIVVLGFTIIAVVAPAISPFDPDRGDIAARLQPPAWMGGKGKHLLGTDSVGRDLLSRIIYGTRVSLSIGVITIVISAGVGTALGLVVGWGSTWVGPLLSRLADLLLAFPMLVFAIGAMTVLGPGFWIIVLALSFQSWVEFFRLVRGGTLVQREREYVQAARALGRSTVGILVREILPNIFHSVLVLGTLRVGYIIIAEASLSFLGIGIQPPTPAWGSMISDGREFMFNAWWIATFPGLVAITLVLGLNLLGEGLRDILDPRLRRL